MYDVNLDSKLSGINKYTKIQKYTANISTLYVFVLQIEKYRKC